MLIGKRIKELRIEKGLSQQQLGEIIGVTKVSVCGYENGSRIPSLEVFEMMIELFGTTADYLLGREIVIKDDNTREFVGTMSQDDVNLITELRHYNNLYTKMTKDTKRYINLINKKMN